jgi:hypothetical protein
MMHIYAMLFLIGVLGLLAQTLLGMAGPHGAGSHGHAHAGHSHAGHHGGHGRGQSGGSRFGELLLSVLSPLTLFSLCVGVGATGLILRPYHLADIVRTSLSLLGGLVFYVLLIKPIWGLIFQFASTPAGALEGTVAGVAEALSRFDASGKGLVRLTIDGQIVRVLAFLEPDERGQADLVKPGDTLTVVSVDGHANTCRVTRL